MAVNDAGSILGALDMAIKAFVLAGLPTTRTLMLLFALSLIALPCIEKNLGIPNK